MNDCAHESIRWLLNGAGAAPRLAMVVAHPDDESIGAGGRLDRLRAASIMYLTDGAPRDLADAAAAGFSSREAYAEARAVELACALGEAGIDRRNVHCLNYVDQEAALALAQAARAVADFLERTRSETVLTHPYEGGHPDHDAAAFAVSGACTILKRRGDPAPEVLEMTSYHRRGDALETGAFLPRAGVPEFTARMSDAERRLKARLFNCYRTQRRVLGAFGIEVEIFRCAPAYDFTAPPHSGALHYETLDWPLTGERWRRLAAHALAEIAAS